MAGKQTEDIIDTSITEETIVTTEEKLSAAKEANKKATQAAKEAAKANAEATAAVAKDTAKKTRQAARKGAEVTKEAAKKGAEVTKEAAKKGAEVTKEAAKKGAEVTKEAAQKGAEVTKEAAKKAGKATKETAEKIKEGAETSKTYTRKPRRKVVIQYFGREVQEDELIERAIAQFASTEGATPVKKIALYIKPEEMAAYYVINGQFTGRVEF